MRISDPKKREFYERSAVEGSWKLEQLARQIETFSYERIASSKDKDRAAKLLAKAPRKGVAEELCRGAGWEFFCVYRGRDGMDEVRIG